MKEKRKLLDLETIVYERGKKGETLSLNIFSLPVLFSPGSERKNFAKDCYSSCILAFLHVTHYKLCEHLLM